MSAAEPALSPAGRVTVGEIALACALGYLDLRFAGAWRAQHTRLVQWLDAFSAAVPAFQRLCRALHAVTRILDRFFDHITMYLGIDCPALPRTNSSVRAANYRTYFDAATRAAVDSIYASDIEAF